MTNKADDRCRVLVVEDESMVAMLIEDMLEELGHRVVATVGTVERAMREVSAAEFDFAILDVNLGGEFSYAVAGALAAHGIPFLFATGYGASGVEAEWRREAPILQKPFRQRELDCAIRTILSAACSAGGPTGPT